VQTATQQQVPQARTSDPLGNVGHFGRVLAPAVLRPVAILEVIIGIGLVVGLCYLLRPGDPLLLGIGFPWIWLAVSVLALRYGALLGVLGGVCIWGAWYAFYGRVEGAEFPIMFFVGGMAQVVIAGHFSDIWTNRANRVKSINSYLNDRLVSITNNHYLLRISHERLEHDVLTRPVTLRDAIMRLRDLSPSTPEGELNEGALPSAQDMLELVALTCQIDVASIFPMTPQGFSRKSVAWVGDTFTLNPDDALLLDSIEKGSLSHLREIDETGQSAYLVCAPIVAASGTVSGVLVVRRMSFLSLNFDNLQLMLVLLNYYADSVEQRAMVAAVQRTVPQCPYEFALELARLEHMKHSSDIDSSLVALVFPRDADGDSLFDQVMRTRRTLDILWTLRGEDQQVAITLMPVTDENGITGYLTRTESRLKSQFDTDFISSHIAVHSATVEAKAPGDSLRKLLLRCGYHG